MKCKNHREEEAKYICDKCKMPICEACATDVRGSKVCINCIDHSLYAERDRVQRISLWNKLVFFMFACIPGAAHMSMGLFKRGMQLMLTFFGSIVLISYASLESFILIAVIPAWFFSFFDAYNARRKMLAGERVEDNEAYNYEFIIKNKKLLGFALLVFGAIGMLNALGEVFETVLRSIGIDYYQLYWALKRGIIPFVLILGGIWLLSKVKKAEKEIGE